MWPLSNQPLVILAPMDGYTNPPFRRFIKCIAPEALVFSEFLSANQVANKPSLAQRLFKIYPDEEPVVIQLYGKDPGDFEKAAILAERSGAAGIDVNMGCPAKKVVAHQHGSALMKNMDLACDIITRLKKAVSVPITVKTRLGWENSEQLIPFCLRLQDCGLDAITIHGRTYRQKFEGTADWKPIYELGSALTIPVFGNGDINSVESARLKLGNLKGVMVGRGAVADPWLMQRICDHFGGREPARTPLPFKVKAPYWRRFAEMTVEHGPELFACRAFRKYLAKMVNELGLSRDIKRKATSVECLNDIYAVIDMLEELNRFQAA